MEKELTYLFCTSLASSTRRGLCHGLNKHPKLEKGKIEVTSYHYDYLPRLTQDFNWKKLKGLKLTLDQREVKHEIAENIYIHLIKSIMRTEVSTKVVVRILNSQIVYFLVRINENN